MAYIKLELDHPIVDGEVVTFKAPCDCTAVEGIKVYYIELTETSETQLNATFTFKDAHGNTLTNIGNLFMSGAYIKAILDTTNNYAYIQNADTNAYLEQKFSGCAPAGYGLGAQCGVLVDDANDVNKCGWYYTHSGSTNVPDYYSPMVVHSRDNNYMAQEILTRLGERYYRAKDGDNGWSEWYQVFSSKHIGWKKIAVSVSSGLSGNIYCPGVTPNSTILVFRTDATSSGGMEAVASAAYYTTGHINFSTGNSWSGTMTVSVFWTK